MQIGYSKYAKGDLMEALCLYNNTLCFFPPDIKDPSKYKFPLIVANRSLVLYEMGSYKPALQNTNLTQYRGYPQNLLYKLKGGQAACFCALGQMEVAKKCFQRAEDSLSRYTTKNKKDLKNASTYINDKKKLLKAQTERWQQSKTNLSNVLYQTQTQIPNMYNEG